jgi:tRNA dimethylallyltransferase
MRPPAIFIMGPTGTGKTDLAVRLIGAIPAQIISVDSAMVYRSMNIGTAKPTPDVLAKAPHHLIDIRDPEEAYSAADFRTDALAAAAAIVTHGRIPLFVGGTGLYFRALLQGIADLPSADPAVRVRIDNQARRLGWAALHARLVQVDPQSAARIHPNDPQRIQRALEVFELTGSPMTELWQRTEQPALPFEPIKILILPQERARLYTHLEVRFQRMVEHGFVDEVRQLRERPHLDLTKPSMRMVGYRQLWQYLDGAMTWETATTKAVIATRNLAKRQLTWFRAERNVASFDSDDPAVYCEVLAHLKSRLHSAFG